MKRIFFIILCLVGGWMSLHAQAKYRVYSYEGKVQYKQSGKNSSLQAVKADLILEAMDTICVAKGSKIRIIDTQRNKIYTIEEKSNNAVYNLVKDAKNSLAKRILNSLTRSLFSAKQDTLKHTMKVLGAGSRGQGGKIDYYDMAEQLAWIGAQACSGKKSPKIEGITLKRHKLSSGELDFEFENRTNKDYHINVLHVNKRTHVISLCYVITQEIAAGSCPITPSGYCSCAMDVYFPDTQDDVYVLFATVEPYDTEILDNELEYHYTNTTKKTNTDIQYMW